MQDQLRMENDNQFQQKCVTDLQLVLATMAYLQIHSIFEAILSNKEVV